MPFIIGVSDGDFVNDYYGGSTYVYQGELFPSLTNREDAKQYKSKKGAERSAELLSRKCSGLFFVIEVTE